jgi:hypothetical protein
MSATRNPVLVLGDQLGEPSAAFDGFDANRRAAIRRQAEHCRIEFAADKRRRGVAS